MKKRRANSYSGSPIKPIMRYYDYQALDDGAFEFGWTKEAVKEFDSLWKKNVSIWRIAKILERDPDEVGILMVDRSRKGKIKNRPQGAH